MEKKPLTNLSYTNHVVSSDSLVTPYEETRAGFIALALEKNRKATPFVEEAKSLKEIASQALNPDDLLNIIEIQPSILVAAGVSDKAAKHLTESDKIKAVKGLIDDFLKPAGEDFVDELVYRFLLTKGDALGGILRNLGGALAERKFARAVISALCIENRGYFWLHSKSGKWIKKALDDTDIELNLKGLSWHTNNKARTLLFNLKVPVVNKNVDLCLFDCEPESISKPGKQSAIYEYDLYMALGELKGGIDPAGADEHWKTANSALERIRKAFSEENLNPKTFFVGAAIAKAMAEEIFHQLNSQTMINAANLTNENQVASLCRWLIHL